MKQLVSYFFKLIQKDNHIPIYGDGQTSRDYTYIDDIMDGILKSIDRVKGYEIINLGESKTIQLKDLIQSIEKIVGKAVRKDYLEMQPGDVLQTYADISKARELLDYNPTTDMETGLQKFYEWFQNLE